jgi:hypothetical protein
MGSLPARRLLGLLRMGVGVGALATPRLAAKAFGVDPERASPWVTRLFGSRELLLALYLLTARPDQVQHAATFGAAVDGMDVVSSAVELRAGRVSGYTFVSGGVGAALFAMLGLLARAEAQGGAVAEDNRVPPA